MFVGLKKVWKRITASLLAAGIALSAAVPVFAGDGETKEVKGQVVLAGEAFTLGQGYFYYPTKVDFYEGDTCADVILRAFEEAGIEAKYSSGYLSALKGVDKGYVCLPKYLETYLEQSGVTLEKNDDEWLGQFDYTSMSGWMYTVNGQMANVGMASYPVSQGDVIRLQFSTYGYGYDIGAGWSASAEMADKTEMTQFLSDVTEEVANNLIMGDYLWKLFPDALTVSDVVKDLTEADLSSKAPGWICGDITDGVTEEALNYVVNQTYDSMINEYDWDVVNNYLSERKDTASEYLYNYRRSEQNDENGKEWEEAVEEGINNVQNAEDAQAVVNAFKAAKAALNFLANGGEEPDPEEPPVPSDIPDDFENDLWLQYDFKELQVGETADIYPRRVPQIVSDAVANDVFRPTFHFEVVSGRSVELDADKTDDKVTVTAKRPGNTIIKVTYDAVEYKGTEYGASAASNAAYVVFSVSKEDPADTGISIRPKASIKVGEPLTSYDTIYFTEGDTVDYTYYLAVDNADSVKVTCNGHEVKGGKDGAYVLPLENRSNIIGVTAKNDKGTRYFYQVIDARKIEINVANQSNPGKPLETGDTATISFKGIANPVYKLATIYNPTIPNLWGGKGTYVEYTNESLSDETFKGYCSQWDLATKNSFDVTFDESGDYTFTGGRIFSSWWGSQLGADKGVYGQGDPNLNAPILERYFCELPDFTVSVKKTEAEILQDAKDAASAELDGYKDPANYDDAAKDAMADVIAAAKDAIAAAEDKDAVDKALADAKAALDVIEEAYNAKMLEAAKAAAIAELEAYKDPSDFDEATGKALEEAVASGKKAIEAAEDAAAVKKALSEAKASLDAIAKDYTDRKELSEAKGAALAELQNYKDPSVYDEAGKAALAEILESGKKAIEEAADKAAVAKALANAKTAMDAVKKDSTIGDNDPDQSTINVDDVLQRALAYIYRTVTEPTIGTFGGEWSVMALAGGKYPVASGYYDGYYANVVQALQENGGILSGDRKYTEYSRVIMGLAAIGKDATDVGGYNLVEKLMNVDKVSVQGINGSIYALIALDTRNYQGSDESVREKYIEAILANEVAGGGFDLSGASADPDLTAMAIQALTPYRDRKNVAAAIDRGLQVLSNLQREDGGFASWGSVNSESASQVIIALCGLGIDPQKDTRFIKNGHSLLEALLAYEAEGGGFLHVQAGDSTGGGSEGGVVSAMATDQAALALLSYQRLTTGGAPIYDHTSSAKGEKPLKEYASKDNSGTWKQYSDGHWEFWAGETPAPLTGWQKIDGVWYHFDMDGKMETGWFKENGKTYRLRSWGGMQIGWFRVGDSWYFAGTDGTLRTAASFGETIFSYPTQDGGIWQKDASGNWSFRFPEEALTGWQQVDGDWYFFGSKGVMVTGWQMVNGIWYNFGANGKMVTGWKQISGSWYYLLPWGGMQTGWKKVDNVWYYFDRSGAMLTSAVTPDGYRVDASGRLAD